MVNGKWQRGAGGGIVPDSLCHKVNISIFQWQENVNSCNIFAGKMIADDLKSKIWKVCGIFF